MGKDIIMGTDIISGKHTRSATLIGGDESACCAFQNCAMGISGAHTGTAVHAPHTPSIQHSEQRSIP